MATPAQIEANRRNAQLSTGPRTPEGKAASRRNAVKHGLAGAGVVLPAELEEQVARRVEEWGPELDPHGRSGRWAMEELARESVRIDACHREESALRARECRRAALHWEEDRRRSAEELARGLARRPGLIRRRLRSTAQGCAWLIGRWDELLSADGWDDARAAKALDLLGIDPEVRHAGRRPTRAEAEAERAELRTMKAGALDELDAEERADAVRGVASPSIELRRLRRYEAGCFRRFRWAWKDLKPARGAPRPPRDDRTASPARPSPEPRPAPVPRPAIVEEAPRAPEHPAEARPAATNATRPPFAFDLLDAPRPSFVPIAAGRRPDPPARRERR